MYYAKKASASLWAKTERIPLNLFATILESCAIIAKLPVEDARNFGIIFGTFFQIKNDLNPESAKADKDNEIYTIVDIIGIEKTLNLLDNYKEEMSKIIDTFPEDVYKKELKDLIDSIWLIKKVLKLI